MKNKWMKMLAICMTVVMLITAVPVFGSAADETPIAVAETADDKKVDLPGALLDAVKDLVQEGESDPRREEMKHELEDVLHVIVYGAFVESILEIIAQILLAPILIFTKLSAK